MQKASRASASGFSPSSIASDDGTVRSDGFDASMRGEGGTPSLGERRGRGRGMMKRWADGSDGFDASMRGEEEEHRARERGEEEGEG